MSVDASEVERHLGGVEYPATKDDLISAADAAGASDEVIARLQAAHGEQFEDGDELRAALDPD